MVESTVGRELVGRGAIAGRRLFREWFDSLDAAARKGDPTAYVFVMGSMVELLRVFDLPVTFPEINSLQTAVRHVAGDYIGEAEDYGYATDVCGYVKADVALQLRGGEHPMGRIPRPAVAVLTNACNTYIKWAEIWQRLYGTPVFTLDVPMSRSMADAASGSGFAADRRYVEEQIRELIALCEEVTGRRFDIDRLREVLDVTNAMGRSWRRLLELNRRAPAPFDALIEGTIFLGVANGLRGTPEGAAYFADLVEEMRYKVDAGLGTADATGEEHRLIFVGVPCYPIFRRFYELFSEWGGVFVGSSYLWFASGGLNTDFEYDLARPIESLAEGTLLGVRRATDSMLFQDRLLVEAADAYDAEGIVYHPVKSCRTVSTGLADSRRAVMEQRDLMCLYIESDMMDKRAVAEAQLKNRIDAFFEGLNARKLRLAAEAAGSHAEAAG
jgi:benzoyl-CoA reductase subunit B